MERMQKFVFLCVAIAVPLLSVYAAAPIVVSLSSKTPMEGDVLKVTVDRLPKEVIPISAILGEQTAQFFLLDGKYTAALGLKVTAPVGFQKISIRFSDGTIIEQSVNVQKRKIVEDYFSVPPSAGATPVEVIQRVNSENVRINQIIGAVSTSSYITGRFGLPLSDNRRITDRYGVLRKMDDGQAVWHLGVDFAAPAGRVVAAMNGGVVRLATSTFSYGNMIVVDHGGGIFSMYMHLSKMLAKEGQRVEKGSVLGLVGTTGLSTGNHVHLSIKVNGVSVDPLQFIKIF